MAVRERTDRVLTSVGAVLDRPDLTAGARTAATLGQQRIWLDGLLLPGTAVHHVAVAVEIAGPLDASALERSLATILDRQQILRAGFTRDGDALTYAAIPAAPELQRRDLAAYPPDERARRHAELRVRESRRPFDVTSGPLVRFTLVRLGAVRHELLVVLHQLATDQQSLHVFQHELLTSYGAFTGGSDLALVPLPSRSADAARGRREAPTPDLGTGAGYWEQQLAGIPDDLELPFSRHADTASREAATVPLALPPAAVRAVQALDPVGGVTPFMAGLTAFVLLLHRYTGRRDLVVGTLADRRSGDADQVQGFLVDPLPLRVRLPEDPYLRDVLDEVRTTTLAALAHQDAWLSRALEQGQPDSAGHPARDLRFVCGQPLGGPRTVAGATFSFATFDSGDTPSDLDIQLYERDGGLEGFIRYRTARLDGGDIERMAQHLPALLTQLGNQPGERLSNLSLLDDDEWRQVVVDWNDTTSAYARAGSLPQLFEEWAERTPDAPALRYGEFELSYGELEARANQLAHHLRGLGVEAEARVGLCFHSRIDWVIGAMATLKAGGAYVPLDPSYPRERLAYMCRDSGLQAVLLTSELGDHLPADCGHRVLTDEVAQDVAGQPTTRPPRRLHPDGLAYVMFTSGSTGQPKGVGVSHRNVIRLVRDTNYIAVRPTDTVAHAANISFDAATFEAWGALLNGARLVVLDVDDVLVPERLRHQLQTHQISVLFLATSLTRQIAVDAPDTFGAVRHFTFGGEQADQRATARLLRHCPETEILNAYGPTEGTTYTTTYRCNDITEADAVIPIGRPVGNTTAYVLDAYLQPVPPGIVGELYAGGDGVARGYLGRPGLTADRFVPDPFASEPGARLYRTGDLVRQRPDGAIEFVGRADQQVKVRGFRVELGEIEECLRGWDRLDEVIVRVDRDAEGDVRLVAYVVLDSMVGGAVEQLRRHAEERLPEYMVPAAFVALPRLPLNPNGKIDVRALPAPPWRATGKKGAAAPRTPTEHTLAGIWHQVLGVGVVGVHDNFFDLGGRSLKASRVRSRLSAALGVDLPLRLVFDHPTVAALAAAADQLVAAGSARSAGAHDGSRVSAGSVADLLAEIERAADLEGKT